MIDSVLGMRSRLFSTAVGVVILAVGSARSWSPMTIFYALSAVTIVLLIVAGVAATRQIINYREGEEKKKEK